MANIERKASSASVNGYPTTIYGPISLEETAYNGAVVAGDGLSGDYVLEYIIDFADQPASYTSEDNPMLVTLPVGAVPKACFVDVLSTISGGAGFTVGLSQPDGTVIDADGLVASSAATAGHIVGAGAVLNTKVATASQLTIGGDRTAGKIKVTVKYRLSA